MDSDALAKAIDQVIGRINTIPAINEQGLKRTPFPDEVIVSLHDHLGNSKLFISDVLYAFNGAEQYVSIKSASRELSAAEDDLFKLHAKLVVNDEEYHVLNRLLHEVDEQLRKATDDEYTQ